MWRNSQNERPIHSLGATGKTAASFAFVCESPDAKRVTSCPPSTSPSASNETTHSTPPYPVGGTGNQHGATIAIFITVLLLPFRPRVSHPRWTRTRARPRDESCLPSAATRSERQTLGDFGDCPAAGRAAPGAAAQACPPPTPAGARRLDRRSEKVSPSAAGLRRPRATGGRSGATPRASAARSDAPRASARTARAPTQ